jgi:hypothetical protein
MFHVIAQANDDITLNMLFFILKGKKEEPKNLGGGDPQKSHVIFRNS